MVKCLKFVVPSLVMTAAALAVVGSQYRHHLMADKFCLLIIITLCSVFYMRRKWLAFLAFGFATGLLIADVDVFGNGFVNDFLRLCAEHRIPAPRKFDMRDFMDNLAHQAYLRRIDQEIALYGYFLATTMAFATCMVADKMLWRKKRGKQRDHSYLRSAFRETHIGHAL